MENYVFGIDVGGTTVKCGLFTADGTVVDKWEIKTDISNNGESIPADIAATVQAKMTEKSIEKAQVLGVGVGVPGPVLADGTVLCCVNLGWGEMNISKVLGDLLDLPAAAGNDANVAALGEMWKGGGQGYRDVVMVTLGTGVGGGIILDGKILAGSRGAAGELGHMIINPEETAICGCGGHGHLEQYTSATGIVRLANMKLKESDVPTTLRAVADIQAKDVFDCAKAGDAFALELVDEVCGILAGALTHVAAVVDPQVFVIGGGVSKAGTLLIDTLKEHYNHNLLSALYNKEFRLATLGNDAGICGAAKMILDRTVNA